MSTATVQSGSTTSRRTLRVAALVIGLLVAVTGALLVSPSRAWAGNDNTAYVNGAQADFHHRDDSFVLFDTACDSHSVYITYGKIGYAGSWRLDLKTGCGTSAKWNLDFIEGNDITFKVCVDIQFGTDRCSDWLIVEA